MIQIQLSKLIIVFVELYKVFVLSAGFAQLVKIIRLKKKDFEAFFMLNLNMFPFFFSQNKTLKTSFEEF